MGTNECLGRTGIEATGAGAAAVRGRQIRREFKRGQNHAQEQPGAHALIDQASILPNPAYAGVGGKDALDYGAGVHVAASFKGRIGGMLAQPGFYASQPFHDYLMVISRAPGIA